MAEKVQKDEENKTEPVASKKEVAEVVSKDASRKWVIVLVAGIAVLYIIIAIGGAWAFHMWNSRDDNGRGSLITSGQMERPRLSGERTFQSRMSQSDGLTTTTTTTTYTQTQGVVTKVNGDSIVVAGGGKSQTIKTDSSTTYIGGTKPAVNDTVVVVGTKDGDTITATQVSVYSY